MKRSVVSMVTEFKMHWKNYVLQSLFAIGVFYIVMLYLGMSESVIIASIGAMAFIVFALPQKLTAQPRNVIGGHRRPPVIDPSFRQVCVICGKKRQLKKTVKIPRFSAHKRVFAVRCAFLRILFVFVVFSRPICGKLRFYGACPFISQEHALTKSKSRDNSLTARISAKEK